MNTLSLAEKDARNGRLQNSINRHFDLFGADETLVLVRAAAEIEHAEFPQYAGHYAGSAWSLVRVTKRVKSKGGVQFEAGDVVMVKAGRTVPEYEGDPMNPTAYSVRLGWDCSIRPNAFKQI